MKIKCACAYCGKELWRVPSEIKRHNHSYCNQTCQGLYRGKRIYKDKPGRKRMGKDVPCDNCGKLRYFAQYMIVKRETGELKGFFCSRQCANKSKINSINTNCKNCQAPLKVFVSMRKVKGNFCNKRCYGQYNHKIAIEEGSSVPYRGPNWYRQRAKAKFRDGYMCCICGETDKTLQVHHIIPFKEFNYVHKENDNYLIANRLDNLITLCERCHKKAEWGRISVWELELAMFPNL